MHIRGLKIAAFDDDLSVAVVVWWVNAHLLNVDEIQVTNEQGSRRDAGHSGDCTYRRG